MTGMPFLIRIRIVYGRRIYGRLQRIPDLLCVGTFFFHVYYMPLWPIFSVVAQGTPDEEHGVQIPIYWPSVLLAWFRTWGILVALVLSATAPLIGTTAACLSFGAMVFALVVAWVIPQFLKPSFPRACWLAKRLNINDDEWTRLRAIYGVKAEDRPLRVFVGGQSIPSDSHHA
jgi:hypothetical protein